ncbi:MAG: 3-oxoacyl-ACP reductase, partial [Pseudomonadota bacterium]
EAITAGLVYLVSADAPSRTILSAAGGGYAVGHMVETAGAYLPPGQQTPEGVAAQWEKIAAKGDFKYYQDAGGPTAHFLTQAQAHKG